MLKSKLFWGLAISGASLAAGVAPAAAEEWHFLIDNQSSASITEILVSENKKNWGRFDVGEGIDAGTTATMIWDQSTNGESCTQWLKASFSDGSHSAPTKFDFCKDLDTPIVFSD
jgi:hypothetical protein